MSLGLLRPLEGEFCFILSGLELNSAGHKHFRINVAHPRAEPSKETLVVPIPGPMEYPQQGKLSQFLLVVSLGVCMTVMCPTKICTWISGCCASLGIITLDKKKKKTVFKKWFPKKSGLVVQLAPRGKIVPFIMPN